MIIVKYYVTSHSSVILKYYTFTRNYAHI